MTEQAEAQVRADAELADKWLKAIAERRHAERKWREEQAPEVIKRYRDTREVGQNQVSKFNILWANVETLKPAIFSRMPIPDVRRRFTTDDKAAKTASLILERALIYSADAYDLHDTLDRCNEDSLLPGRAVAIVRYVPTIEKQQERVPVEPLPEGDEDEPAETTRDELQERFSEEPAKPQYPDGTQFDDQGAYTTQDKETLVYQEVCAEYVAWDLCVFGTAKTWKKVPWVATGALLRKEEVRRRYGEVAEKLDYSHSERETKDGNEKETGHFALLWDVWHKSSREFIVVSEKYDGVVFKQDDPLGLEHFFPVPEPIYSVRNNKSWEPKSEFCLYQDQANELDIVTNRLAKLFEALKVRGGYDQSIDNEQFKFADIMRKPDNTLVPIANWRALVDKGGFEGIVDFLPLEQIVAAIQMLRERESELKQIIYEVTGISDIVRGSTEASETLGAQQLKAQYAGLRISTRQQRFQRFVRDIFCIQAEIIAEHFDPETLKLMANLNVIPDQAFEALKQAKSLPAGAISESEFQAAIQVLRSDKLRGFKVDVETDSTIPADKQSEQQGRVEFLGAVAQFVEKIGPAVVQGMIPPNVAKELLMFGVRGFKVGSELEEVLEQLSKDEQQGPSPEQIQQMQQQLQQLQQENQQLKADQQVKMATAQGDQQVAQFTAKATASTDQWKAEQEMRIKEMTAKHDMALQTMGQKIDAMLAHMKIKQQPETMQ